jgi:hypothetical protein
MVTVRGKVIEQIKGDAAEKHIDKLAKNTLIKTNVVELTNLLCYLKFVIKND